ncbi:DNA polymerase alpha catalytic subunit isoform X2 [Bacillus rossius redtenbacheri]|uniref:DNA polymerase alpha catalytic subunit isoform X2 n=1 Tax=Bacillus rossius redtenbacheri TaxID=93214 RepID=UPI002FDE4077
METETSPAPRAKRQKMDRHGRASAFEKLKKLKGSKHKYEISNVDNVYEEVDEREYSEKVLARQDDDWIVDDDGCGYVEDGRDIFDDDLDDESISSASKKKGREGRSSNKARAGSKIADDSGTPGNKSIRSMFANMPIKKKEVKPVKLEDDDVLGDIMQELQGGRVGPAEGGGPRQSPPRKRELSPSSYLKTLATTPIRPKPAVITPVRPKSEVTTPVRLKPVVTPRSIVVDLQPMEDDDSFIIESTPSCIEKSEESVLNSESPIIETVISDDEFMDTAACDKLDMAIEEFHSQQEAAPILKDEVCASTVDPSSDHMHNGVKAEEDKLLCGWESMQDATSRSNDHALSGDVAVDRSRLPLTTTESGEEVFRFYWWDAFEDYFKMPGVVFLFGKVWIESAKAYVSCCVTVKNIERNVFLLPREEHYDLEKKMSNGKEVSILDVYNEFDKICPKYNILEFKSRKVERSYVFDVPNVPVTSEYLEVRYSASMPALPSNLEGETFSHVFGTTTGALEALLLGRKIRGPGWLDVKAPEAVANPLSWCKIEVATFKPENVCVSALNPPPPAPPLVVAALNIRTAVNQKTSLSEVVMIGCLVHHQFPVDRAPPQPPFQQHFCAFTRPSDQPWPYDVRAATAGFKATRLERSDSERGLLGFFLAKLFKVDPDLIVGHDVCGYGLDVLVHRLLANKIPQWSRLGRLRRGNPAVKHQVERNSTCGRLLCDVKISAKELIRARSYDLGTLCQNVLGLPEGERVDFTMDEVKKMYKSSETLIRLISTTMQDAAYAMRLMCEMNVLPLALQITNIAGNVMSRTLMGGRSERNEFLLLHAFTEKGFIAPDKQYKKAVVQDLDEEDENVPSHGGKGSRRQKAGRGRRKPAYAGGMVLEPKKGFYDKMILLMDFNSLYPSIIQEYNICFTTVPQAAAAIDEGEEEPDLALPEAGSEPGVLPTEIRKLVESRREVKKLMNSPDTPRDLKLQYNIRQMALKLTANSMYGCLGFSHSRFYAKPLAALVTAKGREILMNTKDLVEKLSYEVIYGDTDSLMINTNCVDYDQVFKIGHKIKTEVNRMYRQVELDIDGVFKYMLLLKKKKYAAVTVTRLPSGQFVTQQEVKGLDIVRRDWSQLSAEAGKYVLKQLLSDLGPDERFENIQAHLMKLRDDLENGLVPLPLLTITKQLTKNAEDYADKKSMPHVQVALRINSKGGKKIRQGDTVEYIICEDGGNLPAMQRAYHVDELKASENLKVDFQYYLAQQIHPVVSRLCEPIDGLDSARIAECLGLDPAAYRRSQQNYQNDDQDVTLGEKTCLSEDERYKHCDRFKFMCMNENCKEEITIQGVIRKSDGVEMPSLERCTNTQCSVSPVQYLPSIQNKLMLTIRAYVHKYYQNWLICEDPACTNRTRRLPVRFSRNYPICSLCKKGVMFKEYTESQLYTQLSFFVYIFDTSKIPEKRNLKMSQQLEEAYLSLRKQAEGILKHSAYSVVDLSDLFGQLMLPARSTALARVQVVRPKPEDKLE